MTGTRHIDRYKTVVGLPTINPPSTSTSQWVSLSLYSHASIFIYVTNATTVTGSAITLNQASDVAGTGSKALAFVSYWSNILAGSTDTLAAQTAVSNTFTTLTTNSASALYIIEVQDTDLDLNNNFKAIQVAAATAVAQTMTIAFHLYPRASGNYAFMPTSLT